MYSGGSRHVSRLAISRPSHLKIPGALSRRAMQYRPHVLCIAIDLLFSVVHSWCVIGVSKNSISTIYHARFLNDLLFLFILPNFPMTLQVSKLKIGGYAGQLWPAESPARLVISAGQKWLARMRRPAYSSSF